MKQHLFIAGGLLMGAIFLIRGLEALRSAGFGLQEIYILGGFVIAGLLIRQGLIFGKQKR